MDLANEVMGRIFTEFRYVPGATDTGTPLETVMKQKTGVCQDFAHVMIAALRSVGIPVRYVSGYLETLPPPGKPKLQGADASHAWVEVWTQATGWVGFDPTNTLIPAARHIKVAHGRDYFDVQPLKGIFLGTGTQSLLVQVDVERM
jgi:transglutaminase-like putative cysteine protease